jgi:hypothetical protein
MKVFLPVATNQTLTIIPRFDSTNVSVLIRDEESDITTPITTTSSYIDGYMDIVIAYDFIEGCNYEIIVNDDNGNLIYRGKAYSTAQTDLENFKMNKDIIVI